MGRCLRAQTLDQAGVNLYIAARRSGALDVRYRSHSRGNADVARGPSWASLDILAVSRRRPVHRQLQTYQYTAPAEVTGRQGPKFSWSRELAAPTAVGTAAIACALPMAPAVAPPAETCLSRILSQILGPILGQTALLHRRPGGPGQRRDRCGRCRRTEQHRSADHDKRSRNFGHRHAIPSNPQFSTAINSADCSSLHGCDGFGAGTGRKTAMAPDATLDADALGRLPYGRCPTTR